MRRTRTQAKGWARCAAVVTALALSGCSTVTPVPPPVEEQPEVVIEPPVEAVDTAPPAEPVKPPEPPPLPHVAIVLTNSQPAYADVATELANRLENYDVYDLSDGTRPPVTTLRMINDSESRAVIAIGLRAAQSSVAMAAVPVVFSQVFNYQDHELLNDNTRGVAAVAPVEAQIAAWKEIDPTISRVGVIVGEGHEELLARAQLAAERFDIDLHIQVSRSDQETLYLFKRMIRRIDGYWLIPDNRILSARILQQMLEEANRQRVMVAVPNESLLEMGAAVSFSTVASDIATTILRMVRQIQAGELDRLPPLSPLSEIRVATNDEILRRPAVASTSAQDTDR